MKGETTVSGWCVLAMVVAAMGVGCGRREVSGPGPQPDGTSEPARSLPPPEPARPGRHELTSAGPITLPDLERLSGLGFRPEEIVAEIQRRGLLRAPDAAEKQRIAGWARGESLLENMESPQNLLSPGAVEEFGRRQGGTPDPKQRRAAYEAQVQSSVSWQTRAAEARSRQGGESRQRRAELLSRLGALKEKRLVMKRRGEGATLITIEIERLEREAAQLEPSAESGW